MAMYVTESNGERAGPLVEYERRIAAGELMDGDLCQVCIGGMLIDTTI